MIDFDRFEALTFDCYGTLIDWESGLSTAIRRLLGAAATSGVDSDALLAAYARIETEEEHRSFRRYREVLTSIARRLGAEHGVTVDDAQAEAFAASVPDWPAFPDSSEALRALSKRYRLAIVSNVDDDLFAGSARRLGMDFDEVVTAEQVGSYKPARAHFDEVLDRLGLPMDRVLHVAQSMHHDIAPAKALGFTCVWVDRRAGRGSGGATPPAVAQPDLEVFDLAGLVSLMGL